MWKYALITCALVLAGCQQTRPVNTDYDTSADFGAFHKYTWLSETSGADPAFNPLLAQRVKDALQDGLKARQFEPVSDRTQADFMVRYYIKTDEQTAEPKARGGVSMGSFGGNVGMGISLNFPLGKPVIEQRAQILVDFIKASDQKLAWRGSRSVVLKGEDPNDLSAQIRVIVDQILGEFPPHK